MKTERLDKIIARERNITRSEARSLIKQGVVSLNGVSVKTPDTKCSEEDMLSVNGKPLFQQRFVYIMMNKPKGVISSTEEGGGQTVIDLLPDSMKRRGLFPAGRLDKDTTGFMLITDDGAVAHALLSPAHHIDKTYIAKLDKPFGEAVIADFNGGMVLGGEQLLPAEIEAKNSDNTIAKVILRQGIYHQIKRMFQKHGITVVELRRIAMGDLALDETLKEGACRYLTEAEKNLLTNRK